MTILYGKVKIYLIYKKAKHHLNGTRKFFDFAKKNKVLLFSAPFDLTAVKLLQDLKCPLYKIASPEIQDLELIKKSLQQKTNYN